MNPYQFKQEALLPQTGRQNRV